MNSINDADTSTCDIVDLVMTLGDAKLGEIMIEKQLTGSKEETRTS